MRILVTGVNGMIGSEVMLRAVERGHEVWGTSRSQAWLPHQKLFKNIIVGSKEDHQYAVFHSECDVVIHCAAMTNVDDCEIMPEMAWEANFDLTKSIVYECKSDNIPLIHISTEAVFPDAITSRTESSLIHMPRSVYSITKLAAETVVRTVSQDHSILRLSNVYSGRKWGRRNFAKTVVENLSNGIEVSAWTDQVFQPTLASSAAARIVEIAERKIKGTMHISDASVLLRFDFAMRLAEKMGLPKEKIVPSLMPGPNVGKAPRSKMTMLDVSLANGMLSNKPLVINDGIKRFVKEMNS